MADNLAITAGAGTTIATDDVGGAHYQRIKISNGEADSAVHLGVYAEDEAAADGDTGLLMLAKRTDAPANSSGTDGDYEGLQVSGGKLWTAPLGFPVTVSTEITRQAADTTLYTAGDAMSDSTTAPTSGGFTLTGAARKSGGSIYITDAIITSDNDAATKLSGEILLFNTSVTNINDNAAFAVSDTEIKTCVGLIPFTMFDAGNNQMAVVSGLGILATCVGSANLRFLIRVRNGYTPAGSEKINVMIKGFQVD